MHCADSWTALQSLILPIVALIANNALVLLQATDEQQVAIDKINNLLEGFMGINDSDLGKAVWV